MTSTLTQLATQKTALEQGFLSRQSVAWFQEKIRELKKQPKQLAAEILNDKTRKTRRFVMGGLYHFFYDPLMKDGNRLPYYDIFPLAIPLQKDIDGFLALNLHYLPVKYRALFMEKLMNFASLNAEDDPKRINVTYDILNATKRYSEFKPCIKKYLNSQIQSKIIAIEPFEWETALFLPTAMFKGATQSKIHKESINKIKGRNY